MSKRKNLLVSLVIYICFITFMILVIANKKNLYIDETYSYGLANNHGSIEMTVEDGICYEPAELPFINYLCVEEGEEFDYVNVWINQTNDVHPPLYYILLHTICSFFVGKFSIWYAGIINIIFTILTLYIIRKIVLLMSGDVKLMNIISIAFVCTAGILHTVSFLRMYSMALFFITWITYFFLKLVEKEEVLLRDWIVLIVGSILGAIIHYYCIIYLFFICLVYGCYQVYCKYWKNVYSFLISMCIAGVGTLLVFPAILQHIFIGYRGRQSFGNLKNVSVLTYWNDLQKYCRYINQHLFGGWGGVLVLFIIFTIVFVGFKIEWNKSRFSQICKIRYAILGIPSILYLILIAKIAVYKTDRYIFPIYAVMYAFVLLILYEVFKVLNIRKYYYLLSTCLLILVIGSARNIKWDYLYRETESLIEVAETYSDVECLYVYDEFWKIQPSFYEVSEYKSVTFLKNENIEQLANLKVKDFSELILVVTVEQNEVLECILEMCPYLSIYEEIGTFGAGTTYYLH